MMVCVITHAAEDSSVIRGEGILSVDQYREVGERLNKATDGFKDCIGKRVVMGVVVSRVDNEVISGRIFMDSIKDGLLRNKVTVLDAGADGADFLVKGSVESFTENKESDALKLYVIRFEVISILNRNVVCSTKVEVINKVPQSRFK